MLWTEALLERVERASPDVTKDDADGSEHECGGGPVMNIAASDSDGFENLGLRKLRIAD